MSKSGAFAVLSALAAMGGDASNLMDSMGHYNRSFYRRMHPTQTERAFLLRKKRRRIKAKMEKQSRKVNRKSK